MSLQEICSRHNDSGTLLHNHRISELYNIHHTMELQYRATTDTVSGCVFILCMGVCNCVSNSALSQGETERDREIWGKRDRGGRRKLLHM